MSSRPYRLKKATAGIGIKFKNMSLYSKLNQEKIWNDKESIHYDWKNMILKYIPKICS